MPLLHSLGFNIKSNKYTEPTIPYFPEDEWIYGDGYVEPYSDVFYTNGLLKVGGTDGIYGFGNGIDSYGAYIQFETTSTLDSESYDGCPYSAAFRFFGDLDFRVHFTFRLTQTSGLRFFLGVNSIRYFYANTDDILGYNNAHGFGLLVQEGGNFKITSNNGSSTSYITSDIDTIDTDVHEIYLESDSNNSRWGYSWDGSTMTYISTQNPSGTTLIQPYYNIRNREAGVVKSWKLYMIRAMERWRL